MSGMHMIRGMSSLNRKQSKKNRKPGWEKAKAEHDKWLMARGVHPTQLKQKEKVNVTSLPSYSTECTSVPTSDIVVPIAGKRAANEYSGDYIVGLATLHKSNTVPVGKGDSPEEYAKMRRN